MSFAENLRKCRERKEMTQAELAAAVGIQQPTVAQYEKDMKTPKPATIGEIARVLGVSCDELITGSA